MTETFSNEFGHVTVSVIDNRDGKECWIHDVQGQGPTMAVLMAKARTQAKEWGFKEVWANVNNIRLSRILQDHGWPIEQAIHRGRT